MKYIRHVRVQSPGTSNQHITDVRYSDVSASGPLMEATKQRVVTAIDSGSDTFRSHSDATGAEATVETATSAAGTRYIRTVSNSRETDNLLQLLRF
jgi:hypothetical protein